MVYEPGSLRELGLAEALYLALFPKSMKVLSYSFYRPGERGMFGRIYNLTLQTLLMLNQVTNMLLLPLLLLVTFLGSVASIPLMVPYWVYQWLRPPEPLSIPLLARILAFPAQTLVWLASTPVKIVQIATVLVASLLGPKN